MDRKHAYLIMTHNQPELLNKILHILDNERNDFFIHVDKKSEMDVNSLLTACRKSRVYLTDRINVYWGGWTQIAAELILLEAATSKGKYQYYHLITGADFPLQCSTDILNFFDEHSGENFISMHEVKKNDYLGRVKYYYPLQDHKRNLIVKICQKALLAAQKLLKIDRTKSYSQVKTWAIGSAYFDITDDVARYIVSQKAIIEKVFKNTFCADELFLQTIILNSDLYDKLKLYRDSSIKPHKYIQNTYMDVLRAIDWTRGNPYKWNKEDYNILIHSGCLFARKFDYVNNPEIVDMLYKRIMEY